MKYFYINNKKFNYILEFDSQNSKNKWKTNAPLIEFCENLGIEIPHYCYHKDLSIAGNCRMCLIELKKSPKPVVSCALNAKSTFASNTEIFTNSPLVKKARENIMEFLLLNHPLDCPICDQGGDCDLQDQSLIFGSSKKRFYSFKRIVSNKNLGTIVKTVMTRCIHCTRCVRFASEIAGIEALGTFGRGVDTEIGTYVEKIFHSELSGNVIDICPVGALTSKPYPFIGRGWELKKINTIDPIDSFGANLQIFLKNNAIVKILPRFNDKNIDYNNQWISDKTRFCFDGMFSQNRNLNKIRYFQNSYYQKTQPENLSWNNIFKDIIISIYFLDHLSVHNFKIKPLILVLEETVTVEVTSLLLFLKKKYSFFQLRRVNFLPSINDFETNLQINNITNPKMLDFCNLCLLIGINPRYESPYLNLKLKKRFLKGDISFFSLNSKTDLTYPVTYLGNNFKKLKKIVEGNSSICKTLKNSKRLMTVVNSNTFSRKDSINIFNLLIYLNKIYTKNNWNILNLLNTAVNSVGISYLNNFKTLSKNDLKNNCGMFFINCNIKTNKFYKNLVKQSIDYYLFNSLRSNMSIIIEQNLNNYQHSSAVKLGVPNYFYLPTNNFFQTSGSYINTEGITKKTSKIVSTLKTKDNWQLLRKLLSSLQNIEFMSNVRYNDRLIYNSKNLHSFKNFTNFLYLNTKSLSNISFYLKNESQQFNLSTKKVKKNKLLTTQVKNWIEDFYLGGNDDYSNNSEIMSECSLKLRTQQNTFFNY